MKEPKARLLSPVFMVVNNMLVFVSITLTLLLPQLATYARWFLWSMLMPSGVLPTLMVAIALLLAISNTVTLSSCVLVT